MRAKSAPTNTTEGASEPAARSFVIGQHLFTAPRAVPGLHLVATPIGNLGDITLRALETLAGVDIIACEDTRITRRLTERYGIAALLKPYHEHNAALARPKILEKLAQGASIALVSDAGTPLISDPGFKLVREALRRRPCRDRAAGPVLGADGAGGGGTADRPLLLRGIFAVEAGRAAGAAFGTGRIEATLVMFESGNRVQDTLADLAEIMAGRDAAICRELTKLHEEVLRAPVAELAKAADALETRGEFVLVVGPAAGAPTMAADVLRRSRARSPARGSVKDAVAHAVELRPAAPRDRCSRARTRQGHRGRRWRRLTAQRRPEVTKIASPARVAAFRTGLSAESRASAYLMAKGYLILAKRFRTPYGEIDIVARRRNLVAFIEVEGPAKPRRGGLRGARRASRRASSRRRRPG